MHIYEIIRRIFFRKKNNSKVPNTDNINKNVVI